jgi:flagellar biosynthesis/type III secretory pathway chaperone
MSRDAQLKALIDRHDEALLALRAASEAFDEAVARMRQSMTALADANHQQGRAVEGAIAANQAALELLRDGSHS